MRQNPELHYLDNASTTMVAPAVAEAVNTAMLQHWANPSSLYSLGVESEDVLNRARGAVAKTLGCTAKEIYFTAGGSEGNNMAILGAAQSKHFGKKIVASGFEHASVRRPLESLAQQGYTVVTVAPGADGHLDVEKLAAAVDGCTILVACMMVNNETGVRNDVEKLAAAVKAKNSRTAVHVDAVQAWMRVPVKLDNIDTLSVSGHKIHAPKGIGALYVAERYFQSFRPPYVGGEQEREKRPGTENIPYAVGLATAAQTLFKTMGERDKACRALNAQLRAGLEKLPGVVLNSPADAVPEVLNFSNNCIKSQTMLTFLAEAGVYVSSGSACDKGLPSHTLAAMGRDALAMDTAIRVSLCADNTPEDIEAFLSRYAEGLRTLAHIRK